MLAVQIDPGSPVSLYEQVAAVLRRAIADGECRSGQRLPPAVDLAAVLGVNRNTVLHALRDLRDEGLLEFRRGRGITVVGDSRRGLITAKARELLSLATQHGYRRDEIVRLIEQLP